MITPSQTAERDLAEIVATVTRGERNLAIAMAAAALGRGLEHPLVLVLAAEGLEEQGHAQQAVDLLRKATILAPDGLEVWRRLGRLLATQGMLADALTAFDEALAIDPDAYPVLIDAGAASYKLSDLKASHGYYRRAAELAPEEAEPLSALAVIAARREEPKEARALAERALALRPDSLSAQMALGRADLLDGSASLAEARMTAVLGRPDLTEESRIGVLDLRAEARDVLDRAADAFADYAARNAILHRINAPRVERELQERRVDQARRLATYFAATPAEPWRARTGKDTDVARTARGHVFLLGFPRSGTTLLEKVLASHPGVVTLEEIDHLGKAGEHLLGSNAALKWLSTLTTVEADACRQTYWRGVRGTIGGEISDKLLVDKMPLHTIALPVIAKLFPDAKILFAVRDPRDVVLSCFRRRFQINSAMYEFLTLEGAARYYDQVMLLAKIYRALLPLDIHELRHEALVADFEGEVRKVLAFIGVDWDPAVRGFAARARASLRTPSDPQVARGLNADGVGQWCRYERSLAPVLEILAPWVDHFSYSGAVSPVQSDPLPSSVDSADAGSVKLG
jgi:tetratricopeptide (TPR) repeat protein